jgi:hypothetical protein
MGLKDVFGAVGDEWIQQELMLVLLAQSDDEERVEVAGIDRAVVL